MGKTRFKKNFSKVSFRTPRWKIGKTLKNKLHSFTKKFTPLNAKSYSTRASTKLPKSTIPKASRPKILTSKS